MTARISENIQALLCQILDRESVEMNPEQSLTVDLGFDSMQLMQFFAGVEALYPKLRLEEWFLEQAQEGQDTIESLLRFITNKFSSQKAIAA